MKVKLLPAIVSILSVIGLTLSFSLLAQWLPAQNRVVSDPLGFCDNPLHGKRVARTELLFGLSKADLSAITELEFQHFIDLKVTPLFPDRLTLFDATGQFKNNAGKVVKESSKILLLLYAFSPESHRKIEQIWQAYDTLFQQESMLRVDAQSCISILP